MVREADGLYFVRGRDTAVRPVGEPTHIPVTALPHPKDRCK
jgi:hypothetical protein